MEQNKWSRPGSSGTKAKSSDKKTRRGTSKSSKEEKATPKEKEVTKEVTKEVPAEAAVASPVFVEQLNQLQGTKNARLLMGDKVADEVSISGLQEVLETRKDNGVNTLVMDGIITQRLIELVPKAGIKIIVAEKKGPLPRDPVGITMFTREDLT
jgi:hypothetical protein